MPPATGEQRGCVIIANLNTFNTASPTLVVPPANGDATGLQPLATRNFEYVVQGGGFYIIDTRTDLVTDGEQTSPLNIIGQAWDLKLIDF